MTVSTDDPAPSAQGRALGLLSIQIFFYSLNPSLLFAIGCNSLSSVAWRLAGTAPIFLLVGMKMARYSRAVLFHQFISGIMAIGCAVCWVAGARLTSVGNSLFLFLTAPLSGAVYNCYRERRWPNGIEVVAFVMALTGFGLYTTGGVSADVNWGDGLCAFAGILYTATLVVSSKLPDDKHVVGGLVIGTVVLAICFSPFLFTEDAIQGLERWPFLLGFILSTATAYLLGCFVVRHLKVHLVGLITLIEVPGGVMVGWMWHGYAATFENRALSFVIIGTVLQLLGTATLVAEKRI